MRRLPAFLLCTLVACATSPGRPIDGPWIGNFAPFGSTTWTLAMTLTSAGDSLHGGTDVQSVSFTEHYNVSGTRQGDSLTLVMMPVEDATIHFTGHFTSDHLIGRAWLNAFVDSARAVTFSRE